MEVLTTLVSAIRLAAPPKAQRWRGGISRHTSRPRVRMTRNSLRKPLAAFPCLVYIVCIAGSTGVRCTKERREPSRHVHPEGRPAAPCGGESADQATANDIPRRRRPYFPGRGHDHGTRNAVGKLAGQRATVLEDDSCANYLAFRLMDSGPATPDDRLRLFRLGWTGQRLRHRVCTISMSPCPARHPLRSG